MRITIEQVRQVAKLARLTMPEAELERLAVDMDAMLDFVATLETLDTEGIVPTAHAVPMKNAFRIDELRPSLNRELVMNSAPDHQSGCFRVPKVIE